MAANYSIPPVAPAASRRFCAAIAVGTPGPETHGDPIFNPLSQYPSASPRAHKNAGKLPALRMIPCA